MMKEDERHGDADAAHVIIVRNWAEELKQRALPKRYNARMTSVNWGTLTMLEGIEFGFSMTVTRIQRSG